jgi:hypothetical protein
MTTKRDRKNDEPESAKRPKPRVNEERVKDLDVPEDNVQGVRGGKVNPHDLNFPK